MPEFVTYPPDHPFPGRIGRTIETSAGVAGQADRPEGSPNVVMVVLDDVGYGQLSGFGGLCETPNLDRLASRGQLGQLPDDGAVLPHPRLPADRAQPPHAWACRPSPRCRWATPPTTHDGLRARLAVRDARRAATTRSPSASGTSPHPTPRRSAGPFDRWPLGRGFERFYGFLGGDTDQWHPDLVHDNHWVPSRRCRTRATT